MVIKSIRLENQKNNLNLEKQMKNLAYFFLLTVKSKIKFK